MDFHSKKILITGIKGFTGKYLSGYLTNKGFDIFGISNNVEHIESKIYKCDISDYENLAELINKIQPEVVIHLAAISFVQHENINEIYNTNVIGTQNLLEAIKNQKNKTIQKIILASSATVYGNQKEMELSESMCPNPINHYGISKLAMEFVAKTYFDILPIIIVRPFNYTAPEQNIKFVIPKIATAFKNKLNQIELGNIDVYREYNSINFICDCYYKLIISKYKSEIVNLCSGITHSLSEVISICSNITNHQLSVNINPLFIRKDEIYKLSGNPDKLNRLISIKSEDYSIQKTLQTFFD